MSTGDFDELFSQQAELPISESAREQHLRLIHQLTQLSQKPRRWRWKRWTIVLAAVVGVSGAGFGTAAALGAFTPPTDRRTATCFTTMDLHDPTNREDFAVATSPDDANPSLRDAAASALNICAGGWKQGRFSTSDPKISLDPKSAPWNYPVPPLVACVLPNGEVGVFPGDAPTCASLRLPNAQL